MAWTTHWVCSRACELRSTGMSRPASQGGDRPCRDSMAGPGSHTGSPGEQGHLVLQSKRVLFLPLWKTIGWPVSRSSCRQGRPRGSPEEDRSHLGKRSMAATYARGCVPSDAQPARSECNHGRSMRRSCVTPEATQGTYQMGILKKSL